MFFKAVLRPLALVVPFAMVLFRLALAIVHVAFAVAVFRHSIGLRSEGRRLAFVGPELWTLATLVSGVLGIAAYWLIHGSTLASPKAAPAAASVLDPDLSHFPQA